jgi:hypothetical protein
MIPGTACGVQSFRLNRASIGDQMIVVARTSLNHIRHGSAGASRTISAQVARRESICYLLDRPDARLSKVSLIRPSTQQGVNIVPLFSRLLQGDAKLESCLIKDASHVTKGASGDHVGKIQTALIIVDNAQINKAELRGAVVRRFHGRGRPHL